VGEREVVIAVEALAPAHMDRFARLFEAASSPCYCRYWHFTGVKNDWLDRCAHRPEENLAEQTEAVRLGDASARGLVAIDRDAGDAVVGWMKLAPHEAVPKLTRLPVYRALASEPGSWVVGCFLIDPSRRRDGIARALLRAAEEHVCAWGGRVLLGYPRRSTETLHDEEAWQGPERLFVELGYTPIHDVPPYPVYRKVVAAGTT
jgi:GNAT superfamily N-acetyltransferase